MVGTELTRYFSRLVEIFGEFDGRSPPEPTTEAHLAAINGTFIEFLYRNKFQLLEPFFYQFFTMQGMGSLQEMPASGFLPFQLLSRCVKQTKGIFLS